MSLDPLEESKRVTAAANGMLACFEYDAEITARALMILATVLVEHDATARTLLAVEMLQQVKRMEPRMPLFAKRHWN